MRKHCLLCAVACAAPALVLTTPHARADTVAHWSFDQNAITTDTSGNITNVADATGAHSATVGSGTFAGTDSVAGRFGEGLRFGGDNHLEFANLTELMQSSGAPSYTISMWLQWPSTAAAPTGATPFSVLGDWGHGDAGVPNETSRFVYAFGPNGANTLRGQARRESDSGSGSDIFARTTTLTSPAVVNDDAWHMLTWTFDTTTGALNAYFDGSLVETFNSTAPGFQLADSTSTIGTFGLKGDNDLYLTPDVRLDEVWVLDQVLDADGVQSLFSSNVIPEPSSVALLGLGGLALLRRSRCRKT